MAEGRAHCRGRGHIFPSAAVTFSYFKNDEETDLLFSRTVTATYTTVVIAAVTYRFSSSSLDFVLKMPYTSEQHILATIYILTTNAFVLLANEIVGEPFIRLCTLAQLYSSSFGFLLICSAQIYDKISSPLFIPPFQYLTSQRYIHQLRISSL
ncbi:unnamed protein product [Brugia pahangi]|uniref:Proton_antipo_M domain-containing protein n=1 Tax=Brugia pahangi TaxID=6280 RepID=A0A158PQJ9_BRUPA|nr:unnamed protein product [Brugia pahangi]